MGKIQPPPIFFKVRTIPEVCKFCGAPLHNDLCERCHVLYETQEDPPTNSNLTEKAPLVFGGKTPHAVFLHLVKSQQPYNGVSVSIEPALDIKPWPTEPAEEEPATPKVFRKTITFKMTEKDKRAFKRMMRKHKKLPRKLKKALHHVGFFKTPMERIETEHGAAYKQTVGFAPKDGYPCTKWVKRACLKLKSEAIFVIERQFSAENYKQRGPHSDLIHPTSNLTTEQLKNSKLK